MTILPTYQKYLISLQNNNNSLTKNINTLEAFDLKPLSTSQTFPGAQSSPLTFDLINPQQPQTSTPLQYRTSHGTSPNPSLSSGLGGLATPASPHLGGQSTGPGAARLGSDLTGGSLEVSMDMSQTSRGIILGYFLLNFK